MLSLFGGVSVVLRWLSVGILGSTIGSLLFRGVPLFRRCFVFRCSVFRRSWFYSMPGISCFHKSNYTCLCYFYHMCFIQRWLIGYFLKLSKLDWFLWISHSTLFTACTDQLLYSLSLIKWCSACVKQNTAVKTAIDVCSLLAK